MDLRQPATREQKACAPSTGWRRAVEWPTVALTAALYAAFGVVTWWHAALPWWLVLMLGGYLVCLYGSLQHESLHGHPTPWPRVNEALVFPSLWLWIPYRVYREAHLAHHRNEWLTDPLRDPESFYLAPAEWARAGPLKRRLLTAHNTLAGRLVLGPPLMVLRFLASEANALLRGDRRHLAPWGLHLAGCALALGWVLGACRVPFGEYLLLYVYPGLSLTLLRSFLEHRARESIAERSALIEAGPVMSLLYLNNNLHALHHAEPGLAWYRLPARYRTRREALLSQNGGYRYRSYIEIAARYFLSPKEPVVHPNL